MPLVSEEKDTTVMELKPGFWKTRATPRKPGHFAKLEYRV